jgi:hypothetical protein
MLVMPDVSDEGELRLSVFPPNQADHALVWDEAPRKKFAFFCRCLAGLMAIWRL